MLAFLFLLPLSGLPLSGCSADGERLAVEGLVTLDGRPLELGAIAFVPMEGEAANSSVATVRNGAFQVPASRGLPPGSFRVHIQAFQPTGRTVDDPGFAREELDLIQFNETNLEVTVVAGAANRFEFPLTSVE
ncbi:MAG: hypothetical protein U1E05_17920 [Patescibacteria group bacterium]|nr:hypothetical protein [Patescibacteria group bacterium]